MWHFCSVCVCVCARAHVRACTQSHDMKQFYQGPQLTATWSLMQEELFAFQPLELGISLNLLWILLVYFGNQYIVDHVIWKYFLLFHRLSFCVFFNGFLCAANSFKFNYVTFIYFCFCFHYFRGQIQKIVLWFMSRVFCLCFPLRSCLTKNLVLQSLLIYSFLLYFYMILENVLIISFTCSHADLPKLFIEETSFSLLHIVTSFVFD